jgi:hypothetical protein
MLNWFKHIKVNGVQTNIFKCVRKHCDGKDLFRRQRPTSVLRWTHFLTLPKCFAFPAFLVS